MMRLSRETRHNLHAYLFVLPWLFSLLVFTAYPMLASFYFSFTRYTILKAPEWIGMENFQVMFTKDPLYWTSVWNTLYFTLFSVPLQLLVALFLATLLNYSTRGIGFYRTAFYLPSLVPTVATTLLWMLLLDPRAGLNQRRSSSHWPAQTCLALQCRLVKASACADLIVAGRGRADVDFPGRAQGYSDFFNRSGDN